MTQIKRPAYWQLPEVLKGLPGAEVREESIGADTVLLHITFPKAADVERVSNFARSFSRELPKNVRAVFTEEDIGIKVHRPRTVSLQIMNNTLDSDDLFKQIEALVKDPDIHQVHLTIHGNTIQKAVAQTPAQPGAQGLSGGNGKQVAEKKPRRRAGSSTTPQPLRAVKGKQ